MNRILLLTSTVFPKVNTSSGTSAERRSEYISALKFYLSATDLHIVIVDNSDYDFSLDFPNSNRVEAYHYQALEEDAKYGKGYGEAKIMIYALQHSFFLQKSEQIIKITGRHIIKNINSVLKHCLESSTVYADSDLNTRYAHSYFIVGPREFYQDYLLSRYSDMNDSAGIHFEHVLSKAITAWEYNNNKRKQLYEPLYIVGHPGQSSIAYEKPDFKRKFLIRLKYYIYELKTLYYVCK